MRNWILLLLSLFFSACASSPYSHIDFESWNRTEACCSATGQKWAIASGGTLASQAGQTILDLGGNVVDAAIATAFSLAVERPHSLGIGGGGFMLVSLNKPSQKPIFVDFRETAPSKASRDMYLDAQGNSSPEKSQKGILSVATPGFVPGLFEIHRKWGKLPWKTLLAPSIKIAEEGFPVYLSLEKAIDEEKSFLSKEPYIAELFYPNGNSLKVGDRLIQKDLANTLRRIADNPKTELKTGQTAQLISQFSKERNGILNLMDLKRYQVRYRTPLQYSFKGKELLLPPPPSAGGLLIIEMLNLLKNDRLSELDEADYLHLLAEVLKRAYADRALFIGDPDFSKLKLEFALSPKRAENLRQTIQMEKATPSEKIKPQENGQDPNRHTSHLSILDAEGNGVSMTLTINDHFGSRLAVPGTGIFLNDEMDDFSIKPGTPNLFGLVGSKTNEIAPGKRPASSMTPILALQNGKAVLSLGAAGGSRITSHVFQILLGLFERNHSSLKKALFHPRVHHQWLPDQLDLEKGFSSGIVESLEKRGHVVKNTSRTAISQGVFLNSQGNLEAVFDPRDEGGVTAK